VITTTKDLGKAILGDALKEFRFVKDPEVTQLVNQVGRRLVITTGSNPEGYHFLVVKQAQINAFAVPGGYIFVFDGLLSQVKSVEELAGVLAHEIGHVQRNHFLKDQKKVMAMELATIAAILLGGPEAAILAAGANLNLQLGYSRENEDEADAAALVYLRRAGYRPEGLLSFFETLASFERFNPPILPSYFSTHPGVQDRLRTVSALLRSKTSEQPSTQSMEEERDWERMQVVLRATAGGPERSTADLQRMVEKIIGDNAPEERRHYLLGLAYFKADRIAQAIPEYQAALQLAPGNAVYHADLAYCYLRSKKIDLAHQEAQKTVELSQQVSLAYLVLGMIQAEAGNLGGALGLYQKALSLAPDDPQIHWNMVQAYFKEENKLMGTYHLARYSRLNLEPDKAMEQFKHAQGLAEKGSELAMSIQKEIDEIQQEGI
jgi:predicted Zn-dependent protease